MKLTFKINYHTQWGQNLYVCGSTAELGTNNPTSAVLMQYIDNGNWQVEVPFGKSKAQELSYKYFIKNESDEIVRWEWGEPRTLRLDVKADSLVLADAWRPQSDTDNGDKPSESRIEWHHSPPLPPDSF